MVQRQTDSDILADCGEVWARLFDHRPFINGELKFMVREFEEKRSEREIDRLFSIIENTTDIKDSQIDRLIELTETNIPKLLDSVNRVIKETEPIFNIEKNKLQDKTLENNRAERKKVWNNFIDGMSEKYTRIDNAFEQKEEELSDLYADLEHKLNITTK